MHCCTALDSHFVKLIFEMMQDRLRLERSLSSCNMSNVTGVKRPEWSHNASGPSVSCWRIMMPQSALLPSSFTRLALCSTSCGQPAGSLLHVVSKRHLGTRRDCNADWFLPRRTESHNCGNHISGPVVPARPFWKSIAMMATIASRPFASSAFSLRRLSTGSVAVRTFQP